VAPDGSVIARLMSIALQYCHPGSRIGGTHCWQAPSKRRTHMKVRFTIPSTARLTGNRARVHATVPCTEESTMCLALICYRLSNITSILGRTPV
jgi:hypothetical protein